MSCCAGKCGCGDSCKCSSSCQGCPEGADSSSQTHVLGVTPQKTHSDGSETTMAGEKGCKCGPNCTCNPCNCKDTAGSETMTAGESGCKCGPNCTCNPCDCK